jgi:replication factor C subunit 2/4
MLSTLSDILLARRVTISQLFQSIIYNESIPDIQKNKITLIFSEADKRLVDGSDEHLTVLDLALRIPNVLAGA